jgi:hypothetical protein
MANIQQIRLYTVDHDYGINPNPFFGYCTMGHCKPVIRKRLARHVLRERPDGKAEELGIWLVGIASGNNLKYNRDCGGKVLYAMQVTEVLSYIDYWTDPRFVSKQSHAWSPLAYESHNANFRNCNDNIYAEVEVDSANKVVTGESDYVLISDNFIYWGNSCNIDFGHELYNTVAGGGRYPIYYPEKQENVEKMSKVVEFLSETFGETKHADILGRPIMSADDFNLAEAKEWWI